MPQQNRKLAALACLAHLALSASAFNLVKDYSGATFFDEWDFYGSWDNLTLGDVNWLDRTNATNKKLAYVNDAGNAILKVDNATEVIWQDKRDSVRITTHKEFQLGTIWVADIIHMPFGCSVWPAVWTKGPLWPDDGEIDILEGINLMENNQMALHTHPGCTQVSPAPANQRGVTGQSNCTTVAGCTVRETAPNSFGLGFNNAGGGVYAAQLDATGVFIWFWSRPNVPKSISSATSTSAIENLDDWGPPAASYPTGPSCDTPKFFGPQSLVITITLCGNWAGAPEIYASQCGGQGPTGICYNDNVIGSGKNYDNAYFEIKSIRAYGNYDASSDTTTNTTGTGTSTGTGTGTKGAETTKPTSGALSFSAPSSMWGGAAAFLVGTLALYTHL